MLERVFYTLRLTGCKTISMKMKREEAGGDESTSYRCVPSRLMPEPEDNI